MILARIISIISNPIFILIGLPYFLVIKNTENPLPAWNWTLYTWVFLFLFGLFVVIGVKKKIFSDFDVSRREQRPILYLFAIILSIIYYGGLNFWNGPEVLFICITGIILGTIIGGLVNIRVKASVHVAAASALITGLALVYRGYFFLLFLLIPVICWARVKTKRHSIEEAIAGGLIGGILSLVMYFISKPLLHL